MALGLSAAALRVALAELGGAAVAGGVTTAQAARALQGAAHAEASPSFAEALAARPPPAPAGGTHPPLVAAATVFVAAADDCSFADLLDALLPFLEGTPGAASEPPHAGVAPAGWPPRLCAVRGGAARPHAPPSAPPAYAWVRGLCPEPKAPPSRSARGAASTPTSEAAAPDAAALRSWSAALRAAGTLALVLPPWGDEGAPGGPAFAAPLPAPPPLRCAACLLALLAARAEGARTQLLLPPRAAAWLERAVMRDGYPQLRSAVATRVDAAAAFTRADAASRAFVAQRGGFEAADAAARAAVTAGLLDASCAVLLRRDAAPLKGHVLRATAGVAPAARHLAEHCASMGRLQHAERLLRIALAVIRARGVNASAADQHEAELAVMADLAAVLQAQGQLSEAQSVLRAAVERVRTLHGAKHARTRAAEAQLAQVQQAAGELCVRHFARIAAATRC